jgi:hypothetical protein
MRKLLRIFSSEVELSARREKYHVTDTHSTKTEMGNINSRGTKSRITSLVSNSGTSHIQITTIRAGRIPLEIQWRIPATTPSLKLSRNAPDEAPHHEPNQKRSGRNRNPAHRGSKKIFRYYHAGPVQDSAKRAIPSRCYNIINKPPSASEREENRRAYGKTRK